MLHWPRSVSSDVITIAHSTGGSDDPMHTAIQRDRPLQVFFATPYKLCLLAGLTCRYSAMINKTMTMSKTVTIPKNKEFC